MPEEINIFKSMRHQEHCLEQHQNTGIHKCTCMPIATHTHTHTHTHTPFLAGLPYQITLESGKSLQLDDMKGSTSSLSSKKMQNNHLKVQSIKYEITTDVDNIDSR